MSDEYKVNKTLKEFATVLNDLVKSYSEGSKLSYAELLGAIEATKQQILLEMFGLYFEEDDDEDETDDDYFETNQ